jgi:hypothetical protein
MKNIVIVLSFVGLIVAIGGCRNKRDEERRRMEIERIRQDQEAARLADEQRLLDLQMCARKDTVVMPKRARRSYYVVIGSFRVSGNAYSYQSAMQSTFSNVSVVPRRGWYYVTVGGPFGSRGAATRMLYTVMNTSGGGSSYSPPATESSYGDEEDEEEEDYTEEEEDYTEESDYEDGGEYTEEDGGEDEEEVGADMDDEEESEEEPVEETPMPTTTGYSGQAWVMAL